MSAAPHLALRPVEGPLRDAMRRTGCDPACHSCLRRIAYGELGAFVPALTLHGVEWKDGRKRIDAFRCRLCLGRAVPVQELVFAIEPVLAQRDFLIASATLGLNDPLFAARFVSSIGLVRSVAIGVPFDGPGYWFQAGEDLHAVILNGELRWLGTSELSATPPEVVRRAWRRTVGRRLDEA